MSPVIGTTDQRRQLQVNTGALGIPIVWFINLRTALCTLKPIFAQAGQAGLPFFTFREKLMRVNATQKVKRPSHTETSTPYTTSSIVHVCASAVETSDSHERAGSLSHTSFGCEVDGTLTSAVLPCVAVADLCRLG